MKVAIGQVVMYRMNASLGTGNSAVFETKIGQGRVRKASENGTVYWLETPVNPAPQSDGSFALNVKLVPESDVLDVVTE